MEGVKKLEARDALEKMRDLCLQIDTRNSTDIDKILHTIETTIVRNFLVQNDFSVSKVAYKLGVLRNTMTMRIRRLGLLDLLLEGRNERLRRNWK